MSDEKTELLKVALDDRAYTIEVGTGILAGVGTTIAKLADPTHAVLISDDRVPVEYWETVAGGLSDCGVRVSKIVIPSGEKSKSIGQLEAIWNELLTEGTDRSSVVIAVGGGVVGDLAGFAAASFTRGIRFYQIPTTLLAQVDSSVGGKTGINLPGAKNMVGAFWQPIGVTIDTDVLRSLDERNYRAGMAEVVKYGVIMDASFFGRLQQSTELIRARDPGLLREIILRCCKLKSEVVIEDERELSGRRAILNFGHTFAHGFEAVAGYGELLHGEAVSIGMVCAAHLAYAEGWIGNGVVDQLVYLLEQIGLPTVVPELSLDKVFAAMQSDKKVSHGKLRYILPRSIGEVAFADGIDKMAAMAAMESTR